MNEALPMMKLFADVTLRYEAPKIKPAHLGYCPSGSYAD
jgi:hypothetical protein